jgi:hypothetical protein
MSALETGPLLGLLALGALHGINPAMGWLFAVALGLQEKKGRAVWRALPPLALGHALAIALFAMAAALVGGFVPQRALQWVVAATLLVFGVHRLVRRHAHPRLAGMRVGPRQLTTWSFLVATAHGAGLMVLPLILGRTEAAYAAGVPDGMHALHGAHGGHVASAGMAADQAAALIAAGVHAVGYFAVTAAVALFVYHRLGLRLLRTAWINLDVIWAGALIVTALVTPFL